MNPNLQRALLLYDQSRYEQAETELRQSLATDPHDPYAHALLGLCLANREQFKEATEEAQQAVHLAPDFPFAHYALAHILHDRNRDDEALPVVNEALRLDSSEPSYFALLSGIHLAERHWPAALEAAERGLQLDSEHTACTNLRAIALVKLGRKSEAGQTIDAALSRNPDNSLTHANQGWTLLEKGEPKKALEHFREALRLDPDNGWARQGIVEALKARNIIYAVMLRYFLFMGKLSKRAQWGVVLGGYFGSRALNVVAKTNPDLQPYILPLQVFYLSFVVMTWIADPLFNLLLRLNRFGRLALSREKIVASNWLGVCLLIALVSLGGWLAFGFKSAWLAGAILFGVLLLPTSGTFKCPEGWPRNIMAIYTGGLACVALGSIALFSQSDANQQNLAENAGFLLGALVFIGAFASTWIFNIILSQRRRR
jgi:tetratricopeptide (TPR) repeat protein